VAGKYICVNLHLIWSTKERRRLIRPEWAGRLHAYLGSISQSKKARLIEANSQPDHIHLYVSMPSTISIADLMNAYKSNSTRWINQTFYRGKFFSWQKGYGAFSVSRSQETGIIGYIRDQEKHHRLFDFRKEFIELLKRNGIEYNPKYIWL
jgi:REP element-mobilizing transposase RayT